MDDTFRQYSRTVEYYSRYRPRYPKSLVDWLKAKCAFAATHIIADIGAGTGQMTELLLQQGNPVYAIEPNPDMRRVAENELRAYPGLTSIDATAEATTLPDHSVHLITVGNAFHWFKHDLARQEFRRILIPGGWVVLAWNLERNDGSPFANAFERFWQNHIDPSARFTPLEKRQRPEYLTRFFGADHIKAANLDNSQVCDFDALQGVALSMLKAPRPEDPRYPAMEAELRAIFEQYQEGGTVTLDYDVALFYGQLTA